MRRCLFTAVSGYCDSGDTVTGGCRIYDLIKISEPFNKMKYAILFGNIAGLLFCGIMLNHLFAMSQLSAICMLLLIVFGFAAESLFRYLTLLVEKQTSG